MDWRTVWEYVVGDGNRFEAFCHEAVPRCALTGRARENYKKAPEQAPYDGETRGTCLRHSGRIVFEYKSSENLRSIRADLFGNAKKRGKLRDAAAEPGTRPVLYVLVTASRATAPFRNAVNTFIREHGLPFAFECLDRPVVEEWIKDRPNLQLKFRPPDAATALDKFVADLKAQGAPVDFQQYRRLEDLYVPPREYRRIVKVLHDKRIVFIVGPPHVGKTFTAAQLLRHFQRHGREPRWVVPKHLEREPAPHLAAAFRMPEPKESCVQLVAANVGHDKATYVEDIFGRTSDEEVRWEKLDPAEVLRHLIEYVERDAKDALVVVTSREKIFDKVLEAAPNLKAYVVRLKGRVSMGMDSYTKTDKLDLLRRYARLHACAWWDGEADSPLPPDTLEAAEQLQTPQAVALYCELSRAATTPAQRRRCFKKANQELVRAFANEIKTLDETTLAVLLTAAYCEPGVSLFTAAFPMLAGNDPRAVYRRATETLQDRVHFREDKDKDIEYLEYIHPSYREALDMALRRTPRVRAVFNAMCSTLAQDPNVWLREGAALALAWNFEHLDAWGRSLLQALAQDPEASVRGLAAWVLAGNFERFPWADAHGWENAALFGLRNTSHQCIVSPQGVIATRAAYPAMCR